MPELKTRMGRGAQAGQLLKSDVLRHFCHPCSSLCAAALDDGRSGTPLSNNDAVFRARPNHANS
jgi:hypothetical protein